jgi:hypothetical protein
VDGDDGLRLSAHAVLPAGPLVSTGLAELPKLRLIFGASPVHQSGLGAPRVRHGGAADETGAV